jgi:hypothetical protein
MIDAARSFPLAPIVAHVRSFRHRDWLGPAVKVALKQMAAVGRQDERLPTTVMG